MENNNEFEFKLKEERNGGYWVLSRYNGGSEAVTLPVFHEGKPVKEIGESAFAGCEKLKQVIVPEGIERISYEAFADCTGLTDIKLPRSLVYIETAVFIECINLKTIALSRKTRWSDEEFFDCFFTGELVYLDADVPEEEEEEHRHPFRGRGRRFCTWKPIKGRGEFDFELLYDLVGEGDDGSGTCWALSRYNGGSETVTIPAFHEGRPVKEIGSSAFYTRRARRKLKQVIIPEGIESIGPRAFLNCDHLASLNLPESLISIGDRALDSPNLTRINLPKNVTSLGNWALNGHKLTEITVDKDNPVFTARDGILYDKAMTTLISYPAKKKVDEYCIPDGVISIRPGALTLCRVDRISFPQSLIFIDREDFINCGHIHFTVSEQNPVFYSIDGSLFSKEGRRLLLYHLNHRTCKSYTIPEGTAGIAPRAFAELSRYSGALRGGDPDPDRLFEVKLPRSLVSIPADAFDDSNLISGFVFSEGLEFIEASAFSCCSLKTLALPHSLKYIGEAAFDGCRNLETVTLSAKTKIGYNAFEGFSGEFIILKTVLPAV